MPAGCIQDSQCDADASKPICDTTDGSCKSIYYHYL